MNPIAIFKEVEADLASFGSISGSIRDRVRAGVAALRQIEADVTTMVEFVTKQAQGALDSLQAVAAESTAAVGAAPAVSQTSDGATVTVDPSVGPTTHEDPASGVTTTVPHDGTPPTAVETASATPVTPPPAAVAAAVDASAAAGVTVPAAS